MTSKFKSIYTLLAVFLGSKYFSTAFPYDAMDFSLLNFTLPQSYQ